MSDDYATYFDPDPFGGVDFDAIDEAPSSEEVAQYAAFVAGWAFGQMGGTLYVGDEGKTSHRVAFPRSGLEQARLAAAQGGYHLEVIEDRPERTSVMVRLTRPAPVKSPSFPPGTEHKPWTFKERLEARKCPHCGSLAVASSITLGSGEPPVKHCQACDETWPIEETTDG